MNHHVLVAACLVVACLHGDAAFAATPAEALNQQVVLEFIETPLTDVVDYLTDYTRVRIALDVDGGWDTTQPVTAKINGVTLSSALKRILEARGLTFKAETDRILIAPVDASLPPPEYGPHLDFDQAAEGWIALFDGKSTFGWQGSKIVDGELIGGQTTSSFGDYQLRVYHADAGQMTLGGQAIDFQRGGVSREVGGKGPIVLGDATRIRMLLIKPLNLKSLFNGQDLTGWQRIDRDKLPPEKRPTWQVKDGAIHAKGGPGALESADRYGDFVLQVDVRTRAKHVNGGVFFRSVPGDVMNGYEAQVYNRMIDDDPSQPFTWSTGSIDDRQLARRVVSRDYVKFRMTVIANGPHLATWVNGYQLVDWTDTRAADPNPRKGLRLEPGTIQLQAHDAETDVEFHAVNIAPLE